MRKETEKTMSTAETAIETLGPPRRGRLAVIAVLALGTVLAAAAPAAAKVVHVKEGNIPVNVDGIAIDNSGGPSNGDVWVSEEGLFAANGKVVKYEEDGTPTGVEFTGAATPAGSLQFVDLATFTFADPLEVDSSAGVNAGDLYVADAANHVVDRYSEAGVYECQITGKATPSISECAASSEITGVGGFTPAGVAVDPGDGHVFVTDGATSKIFEFNEAGGYVGEIADPHLTLPRSLAFDAAGDLYVVNGSVFFGGQSVVKFDSTGAYEATLTASGSPVSVAVDRNDGHVYVGSEAGARDFDSSGTQVSSFGSAIAASVDANDFNDRVYIPDAGAVGIYSGPKTVPDATAEPASSVEETTATLNGEVGPDLAHGGTEVEECEFEYGVTESYGATAPCSPTPPYAATTAVSANLTGLTEASTYHFRIKAANDNGVPSFSGDETFITTGPPAVESESVDGITRGGAEFHASVNPHGYATTYEVEYVNQAQYEIDGFDSAQSTAPEAIGSQVSPQSVSKEVSGLTVGTKYHYRVVATSSHGTDEGPDQEFETVPVAGIEGEYVAAALRSAKLEVDVNPLGLDTTCHMEWVSDAEFLESGYAEATTVPCNPEDLGSGSSRVTAKVQLSGLELEGKYHFRAVVENSSGTQVGEDQVFSTFGIKKFEFELLNEAKEPVTQAGGHPWELLTTLEVNDSVYREKTSNVTAVLKDILDELPPGLIGNPEAVPKCKQRIVEEKKCTGDAMIGEVRVIYLGYEGEPQQQRAILYNTIPPKGTAARFAGEVNVSADAYIDSGIRTGGDYGIDSGATNITNTVNLRGVEVTIWGVPADPSHDAERFCPGSGFPGCVSNAEPRALLRLPTSCPGTPLTVGAKVDSFQEPGTFVHTSTDLPAVTGCNQLEFEPTIEARPTTRVSDSPTGLHVDIHNPQNEDPEGLGTPDLKKAVVTLPQGMTVNPAGANGLEGCGSSQVDLHGAGPAHCPDGSKIGTAEVDTPLLDHPLKGSVFLAAPHDNPFDSLLAIYIALDDPQSGVIVKLAGHVEADPSTGQLKTTFDENPQLPFNDFKVDFFSGALAPLRTPGTCGTFSTQSELTPWSAPDTGPAPTPSDSYQIDAGPNGSGCASSAGAQPNSPHFDAGTESPIAARYSPFVLHLQREDGSQEFKDVTVTPPAGLVAKLAGTPYCPDSALAAAAAKSGNAEKASPSCPSASQIGTVNVGAGAGPSPYWAQGEVYLAGPYKGAPLSLAIVTPATAGPFDLGTVVVRSALHVDPETARITAVTDPIPHILEGIPLDVRAVTVKLDKPGFTLNPTSCDATSVGGELNSVLDQSASLAARFQVGDCTSLGFEPKLGLRLFGKTNRGAHPKFRAVLSMPAGDANLAAASVRLPPSEILDQGHIRTVCTRVQFAAESCPAGSIYGYASARSPLLDQPLQGPVYLRSSSHKLPDLVLDLQGQIHIVVVGRIDSVHGGIRNTFEAVPDAPVSTVVLTMKGGSKGLLQNSTNICRGSHKAVSLFEAHSGVVHDIRPALQNGKCGASGGKGQGRASVASGPTR